MEESELLKDQKYRAYTNAVDKALKNFENTSEWADLIAALGKLNKVLTSYTKFPYVPRKIKISKRLAQCMHPSLPAGVHLKALETYDAIFKCMGTKRLAQELFIYSTGLFPLLSYAATPVRPALLCIYEIHFVPLGEHLLPALSGFLSGVLPGLETGSDHYDSTNSLLEKVCASVGPVNFYATLWRCISHDSPARSSAICFALTHINKKSNNAMQAHLEGRNCHLMMYALESAVQDTSVLVQRSALDLLLITLPPHGVPAPTVKVLCAALHTVLRRDMSLNRRLYSWLLGSEVDISSFSPDHIIVQKMKSEHRDNRPDADLYYKEYSHMLLLQALQVILVQSSEQSQADVRPYRILTSLLDKPEIASEILDSILYDVFRALYLTCDNLKETQDCAKRTRKKILSKDCKDLVKHANLLFNTLETHYIWQYVGDLYQRAIGRNSDISIVKNVGTGYPDILELCLLTEFLLEVIPIETYIDSSSEILPNLFVRIITFLSNNLPALSSKEVNETLKLCTNILTKIQPISIKTITKTEQDSSLSTELPINHEMTEKSKSTFDLPSVDKSELQLLKSSGTNQDDIDKRDSLNAGLTLEKSKSDSKLNENDLQKSSSLEERERSNSNQMLRKFQIKSPKSDKKMKSKKSKSSPKLYEAKVKDNVEHPSITDNSLCFSDKIMTTEIENKLIVKCLDMYKKFYVIFMEKVFGKSLLNNYYEYFLMPKKLEEQSQQKFEILLKKCIGEKEQNVTKDISVDVSEIKNSFNTDYCLQDEKESVKLASTMLLEFTAFPNILDREVISDDLPIWLKYLTVISCLDCDSSTDVKLVCTSTFLEIATLSKSLRQFKSSEKNTVVLMGILRNEYVSFIENSTCIVSIMAHTLWDILGLTQSHNQIMTCVSLLYNIHNTFEGQGFAENIIGKYLVEKTDCLEYFKRFTMLWHVGRSLDNKIPVNQMNTKHFDKCLLKILDNLQNEENINMKLFAENFLLHCLMRNDVSRVINPLLLILLNPSTSRISVLHANIEKSEINQSNTVQKSDEVSLKNIYAISSVDGHVMYHIANDAKGKNIKRNFNREVVTIATSLVNDKNIVTEKNKDFKVEETLSEKSKNNVKVFVNPLSMKSEDELSIDSSSSDNLSDSNQEQNETENYILLNEQENDEIYETSDDFEISGDVSKLYKQQMSQLKEKEENQTLASSMHGLIFSPAKKVSNYIEQIEKIHEGLVHDSTSFKDKSLIKSHSLEDSRIKELHKNMEHGHSWTYGSHDNVQRTDSDLEISTAAEDFFKNGTNNSLIIHNILKDIVDEICKNEAVQKEKPSKVMSKSILKNRNAEGPINIGSVHSHLLLYCDVYDSNVILYALRTLKNSVLSCPRILISCLATTALQNNSEIINLLARHRRSVYGHGFYGDITNSEYITCYRGNMYLEALISVCLNYARSFYPNLSTKKLTDYELNNNLKIQLECLDLLNIIIRELVLLVKESGKGFACYIADMLLKCKLQKVLLHSLTSTIKSIESEKKSFTEEILIFNHFIFKNVSGQVSEYIQSSQILLLRLIQSLIALEYHVGLRGECPPVAPVPQQAIFRAAILSALQNPILRPLHRTWTSAVTASLPYFGHSLTQIVLSVIQQLCSNIESISQAYSSTLEPNLILKSFMPDEIANPIKNLSVEFDLTPVDTFDEMCLYSLGNKIQNLGSTGKKSNSDSKRLPKCNEIDMAPDYAITQLETLTVLCHYCLLESSQQSINSLNQPSTLTSSLSTSLTNPGHIINNLLNVFLPTPLSDESNRSAQDSEHYKEARKAVLSHLPRIVTSVTLLWQCVSLDDSETTDSVFGTRKVLRKQLLEFLSPITLHHSCHFLAAIAVAWNERRNDNTNKSILPQMTPTQQCLVHLISAIRVMHVDNLVQTIHTVIKTPPVTKGLKSGLNLDISILELFYCYMQTLTNQQLLEASNSLLTLLKDTPNFNPPAQFLMFAILNEFVQKCSPMTDKKDQKDLLDVTTKIIESLSQISGSCLEQITWLRRNLAVKEGDNLPPNGVSTPDTPTSQSYSVQAQLILAEIVAPLLDVCFGSQEKDKVVSLVSALMNNVVPYLRKHSVRNAASWAACSKLLAALSGYPATRRAWRRDALELLLDPALFRMPADCLPYWRSIVDHLMTHDNTTFRELMSRVSIGQSGGLSLFSSKEQEAEQRAMLLKRLAFVILCGDIDQYSKHMPEIQEQLATGLRMSSSNVASAVFLCGRALLLRLTPLHVTSLWPLLLYECLQILLRIENLLTDDSESINASLSSFDGSWSSFDNLTADGLKLSASMLQFLDLAFLMAPQDLPHYLMYRWAFVDENLNSLENISVQNLFEPHLNRVERLMVTKCGPCEALKPSANNLLKTEPYDYITSIEELHAFIKGLIFRTIDKPTPHEQLISAVELDFLEKMPV